MLNNLESVLELQNLDKKIQNIQEKIQNIPIILKENQKNLNNQKNDLENIKKILSEKQLEKQEFESNLAKVENNIEKYNLELNSVKTNDRYKAILEIIKSEKEKQNELEEKILLYFEELDKINLDLDKQKQKIKIFETEILNKETDLKKEGELLENEIIELEKSRIKSLEIIDDKNFIEIYERIRSHQKGIAIAKVNSETSSCSACNINLPIQKINDILKSSGPVLCENCSKILYIEKI